MSSRSPVSQFIALPTGALLAISIALTACAPQAVPATPAPPSERPTSAPAVETAPVATSTPTPTAAPTATATPEPTPTSAEITRGIQLALDLYARAFNDNDPELLKQAVDQDNLPFRRLVQSRFQEFQQSFLGGDLAFEFEVKDIQRREFGFVQAHIETPEGLAADWLFRQVDGRWVLSEPTVEQVGAPRIVEHEHFTFTTYPWAGDVNNEVIKRMENARLRVQERLSQAPAEKAEVHIIPIYGLTRGTNPSFIAQYLPSQEGLDRIMIYAPRSFLFGFYDPQIGWEQDLENVLTHEYTHMAHERNFDNAGNLATWMSEGLAEYVAGSTSITLAFEAARTGDIIPIVDTESDVLNKQDLAHFYSLDKDIGLAYGLSQSLVTYIVETYGGLDAFWKLARALDETQDLDEALRAAFKVTYTGFDRGWRAWLAK